MFSHCGLLEALIRRQMEKMMRDTFPLRDRELLYKLEKMLRRRLGEEIALPLVLTDVVTNGGVDTVIRKTGDLIALNIKSVCKNILFLLNNIVRFQVLQHVDHVHGRHELFQQSRQQSMRARRGRNMNHSGLVSCQLFPTNNLV